jgi:hypothetical protein
MAFPLVKWHEADVNHVTFKNSKLHIHLTPEAQKTVDAALRIAKLPVVIAVAFMNPVAAIVGLAIGRFCPTDTKAHQDYLQHCWKGMTLECKALTCLFAYVFWPLTETVAALEAGARAGRYLANREA